MGRYSRSLIATGCFWKWKIFPRLGPLQAQAVTVHRKSGSIKETVKDRLLLHTAPLKLRPYGAIQICLLLLLLLQLRQLRPNASWFSSQFSNSALGLGLYTGRNDSGIGLRVQLYCYSILNVFISPEWIYPLAKQTKNDKLNNLTINMNSQHVHNDEVGNTRYCTEQNNL